MRFFICRYEFQSAFEFVLLALLYKRLRIFISFLICLFIQGKWLHDRTVLCGTFFKRVSLMAVLNSNQFCSTESDRGLLDMKVFWNSNNSFLIFSLMVQGWFVLWLILFEFASYIIRECYGFMVRHSRSDIDIW